jgi:hypothetical protein
MHSKVIVLCPACGNDGWCFAEAAYVRALLDAEEADLTEDAGVAKLLCDSCRCAALFDREMVGILGMWDKGRDL